MSESTRSNFFFEQRQRVHSVFRFVHFVSFFAQEQTDRILRQEIVFD